MQLPVEYATDTCVATNGDLLTSADLCRRMSVSRSTVARWVADGLLPVIRTPGGRMRFRPADVEAFIDGQTRPAVATT